MSLVDIWYRIARLVLLRRMPATADSTVCYRDDDVPLAAGMTMWLTWATYYGQPEKLSAGALEIFSCALALHKRVMEGGDGWRAPAGAPRRAAGASAGRPPRRSTWGCPTLATLRSGRVPSPYEYIADERRASFFYMGERTPALQS